MEFQNLDDKIARLGIYELRNLAREVGVPSPTTKRREELMIMIKEIISSGKALPKKTGAGRPAKKMYGQDEIVLSFSNTMEEKKDTFPKTASVTEFVFNQPKISSMEMFGDSLVGVKGVIRHSSSNKKFMLFNRFSMMKKNYVWIPDEFMTKHSLQEGDYVEGVCKLNPAKDMGVLESIDFVDGVSPTLLPKTIENEFILPTKTIDCIDLQIKEGQSVLEGFDDVKTSIEALANRVESLTKNGYVCIALTVNSNIETRIRLERIKNLYSIISMCDDEMEEIHGTVVDAINFANALFARGKKVAFFALNVTEFYNSLDYYFVNFGAKVQNKHSGQTLQLVKKIFAIAKQGSNGSSITVYGTYLHSEIEEYENEMKEILKISQ